jgi:hypothetical protein
VERMMFDRLTRKLREDYGDVRTRRRPQQPATPPEEAPPEESPPAEPPPTEPGA